MVKKITRESTVDQVYLTFVYIFLVLMGLVAIVPLMYVISGSITPYSEILRQGGFVMFPRKITLEAYRQVFVSSNIPNAYKITVFITIVGTSLSLTLSVLLAYPLSRKKMPFRRVLTIFVLIPMVFRPGIIPKYVNMRDLGLINSVWAMIWGACVIVFNVIVLKAFFQTVDENLHEAALIDGASEIRIFLQIVIPLSMPVMVTVGLFYGVQRWNEFLQAILYVNDKSLHPLQPVLNDILTAAESTVDAVEIQAPPQTLKMAAVIVSVIPILMVYPFLQRHFTKGVMLGAIKG